MKAKLIAIVGPTGCKKSFLAMELVKHLKNQAEIISADAFQVYQEITIGINKPTVNELNLVKHHFVNNISINDSWNIKVFKDQAEAIIDKLIKKNILPIVCGGSHLYVDALTKNYNLNNSPKRNLKKYENWTNAAIYDKLYAIDPQEAIKISQANKKRLIRALEIYETTGFKKHELSNNQIPRYDVLYVFCNIKNKQLLIDSLYERTKQMVANGWINEVQMLLKQYPHFLQLQAAKAIGYYYLAECILKNYPIDIAHLQKLVKLLAKRQTTWCKKHYLQNTISYDFYEDDINSVFSLVDQFLKN